MSLISDQVKELRLMAQKVGFASTGVFLLRSADTIELLYEKLQASNTERLGTGGWISCDEQLPEELKNVLVWYEYFRHGDYNCMYQTYGIGFLYKGHWSGDVSGVKAKCIAWQPLPEPYMEGDTQNG